MSLQVLEGLPDGLLDVPAAGLLDVLGGPTLIRLPGREPEPLLISMLAHGNETSGWDGVRALLRDLDTLPRPLWLLLGNLRAAAAGRRVLDGQPDYNRIWRDFVPSPGDGPLAAEAAAFAGAVCELLAGERLFAAVDLHNNTGRNPHYSVVTRQDPQELALALLFSDKAVFLEEPRSTLTGWLTRCGPSIALELGPVGDPECAERARSFVARCLTETPARLAEEGSSDVPGTLQLYRSLGRVRIAEDTDFSFADAPRDTPLVLTAGLEAVNFHALPAGTVFGRAARAVHSVLEVRDGEGREVTDDYFLRDGDDILLKQPVTPAMVTTDAFVIRQDCLCYLMRPISPADPAPAWQ